MKSHGSKTKGMRQFISVVNSWNGYDMRAICNEGQARTMARIERPKSGEVIMLTTLVEPRLQETSVPI